MPGSLRDGYHLPMYYGLTDEDVDTVIETVKKYFEKD